MAIRRRIEIIHNSLINGQLKQMVEQIDDYGLYDFWEDYKDYLNDMEQGVAYNLFAKATISYNRIKNR